jgi:hypothetical protein
VTALSKNLPDQTAAARPRRRSARRRPQLRKTPETPLAASKISLKPGADAPPANTFAKIKRQSLHTHQSRQNPIPHRSVTQQNRR